MLLQLLAYVLIDKITLCKPLNLTRYSCRIFSSWTSNLARVVSSIRTVNASLEPDFSLYATLGYSPHFPSKKAGTMPKIFDEVLLTTYLYTNGGGALIMLVCNL